ncbi:17726_t:CDS:2, partial [Gigaspora rosea]
ANMEENSLYEGKKFSSWIICDLFLDKWKEAIFVNTEKNMNQSLSKKTFTKKISYLWHLNVSCPSNNGKITVNTIVNEHNHELSMESIQFQQDKIFNQDILDNIKFMTEYCNMGATAQRKFLEGKYPLQLIYSKDLYAAICKFRPTKALLNDTATLSNWIDEQKKKDSRWIVARDWDDDNTLTCLF